MFPGYHPSEEGVASRSSGPGLMGEGPGVITALQLALDPEPDPNPDH